MIILGTLQKFRLMIADEPFTGLDPVQIKVLKEHFISIKNERKLSYDFYTLIRYC